MSDVLYMYSKFLVAVDGSGIAERALQHSMFLAKKCNAEILIVHVVSVPAYAQAYRVRIMDHVRAFGTETLKKVEEEAQRSGLKVTTKLLEGDPAGEILTLARKEKCDLIVVGARGLSGFKELLIGSVSHKIAQHAKCPVLIVHA